jgi:hypothetical protein
MKETVERWVGMAVRGAIAYVAYRLFGWIGFGVWVFAVVFEMLIQIVDKQKSILTALEERLTRRCAMCHKEIVNEGGVIHENGRVYHDACSEKIDEMEERERQRQEQLAKAAGAKK